MTHRNATLGALATLAIVAALPATGAAHTAACIDGSIRPDYTNLSPVITDNGDGTTTVRWSDGFTVTTASCAPVPVPVEPAPVPVPEQLQPTPRPTPTPGPTITKTPTPGPRITPPPKRHRYRCPAGLLPSKSWQRIIFRRHGVRCPIRPSRAPRPHIAVAGEWKAAGR